jgi:hypothetical protein
MQMVSGRTRAESTITLRLIQELKKRLTAKLRVGITWRYMFIPVTEDITFAKYISYMK